MLNFQAASFLLGSLRNLSLIVAADSRNWNAEEIRKFFLYFWKHKTRRPMYNPRDIFLRYIPFAGEIGGGNAFAKQPYPDFDGA